MRWWSGSMPGGPPGPANALVVRWYARWAAGRPHALAEIRVPGFWFCNCALRCLGRFPAGFTEGWESGSCRGVGPAGPREPSDRPTRCTMRINPCALPCGFILTFASRSGSRSGAIVPGCSAGPWRFNVSVVGLSGAGHREGRRMRIRRDIPNGCRRRSA